MSKHLFLHCGMHKTGSSAIQDSLAVAPLDEAVFQYLQMGTPNGSLAVSQAFSSKFKQRAARNTGRELSPAQLQRSRNNGFRLIDTALAGWHAPNGIVSAEDISAMVGGDLKRLKAYFEPHCDSMSVILYARMPNSYIESAFQQVLKARMPTFDQKRLNCNFRNRFAPFDAVFGAENVGIHWFSRNRLFNGCIVQDFGKRIGLTVDPAWVKSTNQSLSLEAVKLLYVYRSVIRHREPEDTAVINYLFTVKSGKFRLHQSLAEQLGDISKPQLDWLARRIGEGFPDDGLADDPMAVRSLEELMSPSAETLEALAAKSGVPVDVNSAPEEIVKALRAL